jgi:hypothetical protein
VEQRNLGYGVAVAKGCDLSSIEAVGLCALYCIAVLPKQTQSTFDIRIKLDECCSTFWGKLTGSTGTVYGALKITQCEMDVGR